MFAFILSSEIIMIASKVDSDQTAQSDLNLPCLHAPTGTLYYVTVSNHCVKFIVVCLTLP